MTDHARRLRSALADPRILVAPGGYDALSASLIENAGFAAMYLSGASIAYTRFGRPDIGLVTMSEVAETISVIRERSALPLVADADTGFGNALNVQRTVRLFERMGASGVQLEDQRLPKRCGHLAGKTLISRAEMVGKIRAACDAREQDDTVIIARTDAVAVEGFEHALERARAYAEAGADVLFVEAMRSDEQMRAATQALSPLAPLMANMVEGGHTPMQPADALERLGFAMVIFPGALVRVLTHAATAFLADLHRDGDSRGWQDRMLDFGGINALLGTDELLAHGRAYDEQTMDAR